MCRMNGHEKILLHYNLYLNEMINNRNRKTILIAKFDQIDIH